MEERKTGALNCLIRQTRSGKDSAKSSRVNDARQAEKVTETP